MSLSARSPLDELTLAQIIALPDTNAGIMRRNDYNQPEIKDSPDIRLAKIINSNYVLFYARNDVLDKLMNDPKMYYSTVLLTPLSQFDLEASGISSVQQQPYLSLRGNGVLVGIIDSGIDYSNVAFQWEDGVSKIQSIWDMTIPGEPPDSYLYGTEYTQDQITGALRSEDPFAAVPHRDTAGHGTFLASVAASHEQGMYMGVAPDAELIVVKLKEADAFYKNRYLVPEDVHNVFESSDIMLGIDYCIHTAQRLGRPIAVCIGLGTNQGGHDGYNVMEDYLTSVAYQSGVVVCAAAGNEANAKHHASGALPSTGSSEDVEIRVGESSKDIFLSLWNSAPDRMSVSLKSPTGEIVPRVSARSGETTTNRLIMENATIKITYVFPLSGSGGQATTIRILDPTPGIWKLTVYGEIILDGSYHLWLPITELGNPTAEFLIPDPDYTVVVPAAAVGVITCGAYNSRDKSLYLSSSCGPTRLFQIAPEITGPGVDVGGIIPGNYSSRSGTSIAAAIIAGASALLLQWGMVNGNEATMNTYHVKSILIRGCDRDPGVQYPNNQWGYGRLNLYNSFIQLRLG